MGEWFHKLQRRTDGLRRRVESRTATISRLFDRICALLESRGYLADGGTVVTDDGRMLARIYGDTDLVVAEALRSGAWDDLSAVDLASVCAVLVYESRGKDDGSAARVPSGAAGAAIDDLLRTWDQLKTLEAEFGVNTLPDPDLGLAWPMLRWAQGRSLDSVLWESDLTAGDFVRWTKQVIDLLGQVIQAAAGRPVAEQARIAADLIDRGVIAYSSVRE